MSNIGWNVDTYVARRSSLRFQVEFERGAALQVRRARNGKPSAHPLRGDEVGALRELRGPFAPDATNRLVKRIGARARFAFPIHVHMLRHACGYALANVGHNTIKLAPLPARQVIGQFSGRCRRRRTDQPPSGGASPRASGAGS
jgi:integrase